MGRFGILESFCRWALAAGIYFRACCFSASAHAPSMSSPVDLVVDVVLVWQFMQMCI